MKKLNERFIAFLFPLTLVLILHGCKSSEVEELYHRFPNKTWERFNKLSFEMMIENVNDPYDVGLFICFSQEYPFNTLDYNMVMTTAGGEERINEYQMKVRSEKGLFILECHGDSCIGSMLLKKKLKISKPGVLKIELENLTPRLRSEGIYGIGIRLIPSGQ